MYIHAKGKKGDGEGRSQRTSQHRAVERGDRLACADLIRAPMLIALLTAVSAAPAVAEDVIDVHAAMTEVYAQRSIEAAAQFSGGPVTTLFGEEDTLEDEVFELRRWNAEVATKKYDYLLVGVCAPWDQQVCNNRLHGTWSQMAALASLAKNDSELADAVKASDVSFGIAILNLTSSRSVGRLLQVQKQREVVEIDTYFSVDDEAEKGESGRSGTIPATFRRLHAGNDAVVNAVALYQRALVALKRKRAAKGHAGRKANAQITWAPHEEGPVNVGRWGLQPIVPSTAQALVLDAAKDADVLVLYIKIRCKQCAQLRETVAALANTVAMAGVSSVRFAVAEEADNPRNETWPEELTVPKAFPTMMLYRHGREPIEHMRFPSKANIIAFLEENTRNAEDLASVPGFAVEAAPSDEEESV